MLKLFITLFLCGALKKWANTFLSSFFLFLVLFCRGPTIHSIVYAGLEVDFFGWALMLLSFWVVFLALLRRTKVKTQNKLKSIYLSILWSLLFFLLVTFRVSDILIFYLRFEICLIPILVIILGWGYQPERSSAGIYILFYTLFGSLPLFFVLIFFYKKTGFSYIFSQLTFGVHWFFFLLIMSAFLVKFPIYGVHLWLLKAHVEAPVAGSMILAGVMLKLGGYGLIRVIIIFQGLYIFKEILFSLSVWGAVVTSLSCLRHTDIKLLIARSSVVHIRTCIACLFIMSDWRVIGCIIIIIAHGLCSSGLFCVANIVYERRHRRRILINKGLLNLIPSLSLWWFLLVVANLAGPPSLNLIGEIILLNSLISWRNLTIFFLALLGFFSAGYSLYLYSLTQHGSFTKGIICADNGKSLEFLLMINHVTPLCALVLRFHYIYCFNSLNKILFCGDRDILI